MRAHFQNCYDAPHLRAVHMPIEVEVATVKEDCQTKLLPTPKTICWDEEVELCAAVPELVERDEHLSKCSLTVGEDECQKVRLTIPRELCYPVERYHPYGYPGHKKTRRARQYYKRQLRRS